MRRMGGTGPRGHPIVGALLLVVLASPGCSGVAEPAPRDLSKASASTLVTDASVVTTPPTSSATVSAPPPVPQPTVAEQKARSNGARPDRAIDRSEDVTITATTDKRLVAQGATIKGSLTAVNNSSDTVDITHPSGCETEYGLYFDGKLRTERWFCTSETVDDELAPGETRVWHFDLIARGDLTRYDEGGQHDYAPIPPGRYDLFAGITAYQQLNRPPGELQVRGGAWFGPPLTVEVTA